MKHKFLFFATLVILNFQFSIFNSNAQSVQKTDYGIRANVQGLNVEIQFFTPDIVRIYKTPANVNVTNAAVGISVIKSPEKTDLKISESNNVISLQSKELRVNLDFTTGAVSFAEASQNGRSGSPLLSEQPNGAKFEPFNNAGQATLTAIQKFTLDKNEAIYGLGQQQIDKLNQRNSTVLLKQRYLHACIPIFQSVKGYGVFWDNYSPVTFTDNESGMSLTSQVGECIDYYFMYGKTGDGTVAKIRELTGQAQMYPLWTYGFWQSRERYKTQYELTETVDKYRELGIPLDGIIQDWQYWGGDSLWNAMDFLNPGFPDPKGMIDYVHRQNAHIMISVWPSFGPKTQPYKALKTINGLLDFDTWPPRDGVRPYDAYNPDAREIYWQYLKKGLVDKGIDAWWLDSTEPDHHNEKESDYDLPTAMGTYRNVVNLFPFLTNKGVYEHLRADSEQKRVFLLTRCAFAGQQRFAAQTWSGDVQSTWEAFRQQIPTGLNFSLSGIPYWNTDIGGFFLWDYDGGVSNKAYQELYSRWFQYATFTAMQRSHGSGVNKEIYNLGKRGDWVFDNEERYINLRYRLLPYIYSTAWNVTSNSGSFLRALFMDFADDAATHEIGNCFMFGKSFLVAPVTDPFYVTSIEKKWKNPKEDFGKTQTKTVYLPKNTDWYDFWTGEKMRGGQTVERAVPIDIIPLYVRAGTILPFAEKVQYAAEKPWDNLEIRIYPGADGEFTLYEDENDNYNYEKGEYSTIKFSWNDKKNVLSISERKGSFKGMLKSRKFRVVVVNTTTGIGDKESENCNKTLEYSGKAVRLSL